MKERDLQNFIYFITHHKSLTRKQVARRDALLLRDIYNKNIKKEKKEFVPLSALNTSEFLSQFEEPTKLKYLTHRFDNNDDGRPRTIEELKKVVEENLKAYELPQSLKGLIYGYVFGGNWLDTYGKTHHSCIGSPEWLLWSTNHNNSHPIDNPDFVQEVDAFGSTIRLRGGGLDRICDRVMERLPVHMNLVRNGTDSTDFYTNTYCLFSALHRVFAQMNVRAIQYPNVSISVETSTDMEGRLLQIVTITQDESFSSNSIEYVKNRLHTKNEPGDFGAIRNFLNGYCLWQVENIWNGQPRRLNILRGPSMDEVEEIQRENIYGFTHKFIFY